ncbi:MAG TPA: hypothetical protein VEX60_09670 [Pyrinomonadaceae bacterium]|nr:hypothetical protein [Pyrinomonadaceae bacterium]
MDKKRKIWLAIFIVVSVVSMWARYSYQKSERRRMEETLATLARVQREERMRPAATVEATPDETINETRDMFDSELPRESLEAIRQAVGKDFKLMELLFDGDYVKAIVSTDGQSVQEFTQRRGSKKVEGPAPVNLIGDNPLADSLYELKVADLSLLPKLTKEAVERAGIAEGKVTSARFSYQIIRYKGESPTWTFMVERGTPPDWQYKFVTFDAKGKFKSIS